MTPPHSAEDVTSLWGHLPQNAQEAVAEVVRLLAVQRWTGDITMHCVEGGVRDWYESRKRTPRS